MGRHRDETKPSDIEVKTPESDAKASPNPEGVPGEDKHFAPEVMSEPDPSHSTAEIPKRS